MDFKYVAYTNDHRVVRGSLNAATMDMAERSLRGIGYAPLSLNAVKGLALDQLFPSLFGIKTHDIVEFSRQLALLMECGVSISAALALLQENIRSKALARVVGILNSDLRNGVPFSRALAQHPKVFDDLFCRVVAVGEKTGSLETSLREVVAHLEKQQVALKKIKRSMTYPVIVLVMAVGVIALLTAFVLPQMMGMFTAMKVELPLPTQLLLNFTSFVMQNKLQILVATIILVLGGAIFALNPSGRRQLNRLSLRLPVMGRINVLSELSRFSRVTAMLLHAGLSITETIDLAAKASRNIIVREIMQKVRLDLMQGRGLGVSLGRHRLFLPALVQMVSVGEETGRLEVTLSTVAAAYEVEADERTTAMIGMIEPAMTLFIAIVVGFIALSVVMPMYTLIGSIK
jgi:type IV pilus assembly protein PilC